MQSCPECKNVNEEGDPADTERSIVKPKRYVSCGYCGKLVEEVLTFCSHCGTEKALVKHNDKLPAASKQGKPAAPLPEETQETALPGTLLYRHDATVYLRGLVPSSGAFTISDREIRFKPQIVFRFAQPVNIDMQNVTNVDCSSSASLGFVIKISTKAGVMHKFSLGTVPDMDNIRQVLTRLSQIIKNK